MEIAGATTYSPADNTGRRKKTVVNQTIQQGSTGLAATTKVTTEFVAGRLSWRQINNYQDRKLAP
jgi:type IV pilus assembly protein PilY1